MIAPTRLVVNADDLGLHPSLDAGILRAHREGILCSASLMVTGAHAEAGVRNANAQGLSLGVHLTLCSGLPPAARPDEVPTVAPGGRFRTGWARFVRDWFSGRVRSAEVARELAAQLERARALGCQPDHLDSHQHLHVLPGIDRIVEALARSERLPVRMPVARPSRAWLGRPAAALKTSLVALLARARGIGRGVRGVSGLGVFEAGALDERTLLDLIAWLPAGDFELGCHPGEGVPRVEEDPGWTYGWPRELAALCSHRVRDALAARRVELTTYRGLGSAR